MRKEIIGPATLYNADCRDVFPLIQGVDAVVTSPPYNQNIDQFKPSGMHKNNSWVQKIGAGYFDSLEEPDYQISQIDLLNNLFRITNPIASIFYNHKIRWRDGNIIDPKVWLLKSDWKLRQELIWDRGGSVTMNARMFAPNDERIYWMIKKDHKWNQDCASFMSIWKLAPTVNPDHPCVYPIDIPLRCISATTEKNDLIFDPFTGSGTTGIAAIKLGRRFVGTEISPKYFDLTCRRITDAVQQGEGLFGI